MDERAANRAEVNRACVAKRYHRVIDWNIKLNDTSSTGQAGTAERNVNKASAFVCVCIICRHSVLILLFFFPTPAKKYDNGEYLNITGITRDQAGDYECSALNDIASPDTKTVKVTVNCEYVYASSSPSTARFLRQHQRVDFRRHTTTKPSEVFIFYIFFGGGVKKFFKNWIFLIFNARIPFLSAHVDD